ncbi:hypothetical protein Plhal703r1_c04g0023431 [Plasmopara halstedii]
MSVSAYQQYRWLRRLHNEATLRGMCMMHRSHPGVSWVCPKPPYLGARKGERICVAPTTTKPHSIQLYDDQAR